MAKQTKTAAPAVPEVAGDYGGGVSAKRVSLENTRIIERAIREGWPIPDEYRKPLIDRQVRIAVDVQVSPRESTSATRAILMAERQNMIRERWALELAGLVGPARDPFEGPQQPTAIAATQINIHLPSNQRGDVPVTIEQNAPSTKPKRRRARQ